jgi:hypothetical protein
MRAEMVEVQTKSSSTSGSLHRHYPHAPPPANIPSAGKIFTYSLPAALRAHVHSLKVSLHGSLAATGMGHMTPHAVLLGLMGEDPESVEVGRLGRVLDEVKAVGQIDLGLDAGEHKRVKFNVDKDLVSLVAMI